VLTGAFTLGGVTLGVVLDWLRSTGASRRAAARERDDLFTQLTAACARLMTAAHVWRNVNKPSAKMRQALYGMMESEAHRPFSAGDDAIAVARQLMSSAAVNGLRYLWPVNVAETIRSDLLPLMSETAVLAIRLSMAGDWGLKESAVRVSDAVGALTANMAARERDYAKLEADLNAAIGQLRRARDAAAAQRWYRKRRKS
jgi:hypothetical protein